MIRNNEFFQRWMSQPTEETKNRYRRFRNKVTQLICHVKQSTCEKSLGKNTTSRPNYRSLKGLEKKSNEPTLLDPEQLNEQFATIGPLLFSKIAKQHNDIKIDRASKIIVEQFKKTEVIKLIKLMRNKKSSGHDRNSNNILKCCSPANDTVIAKFFNRCLKEQCFSKFLKIPKIVPIHKKGDRFQPQKYKANSLVTSINKVFEKLSQKWLIKFLD